MIDGFVGLSDAPVRLTTKKKAPKRAATASVPPRRRASAEDLAFLSANQQREGFPGLIPEAIAAHPPDMEKIVRSAKRLGAQIPTEANRKRPPLF